MTSHLPLAPYRVLDLSWHYAGPFATKLLADFGAEIIKVERPGGDPTRTHGPFPTSGPNPEASAAFLYLNNNKYGQSIDLKSDKGRQHALALAAGADIVVEGFRPGVIDRLGLGYDELRKVNPDVILISVSSFGQDGPYAGYRATDLTLWGMGEVPYISGSPDRAPVKTYGAQASYHTAANAAFAALAALWRREITGQGQHIDVSAFESVANLIEFSLGLYECLGVVHRRRPKTTTSFYPNGIQQTADGEILLSFGSRKGSQVADALGLPALNDPRFDVNAGRRKYREEFDAIFKPWLATQSVDSVLFNMQLKAKLPIAKINRLDQLMRDTQYLYREYFVDLEHPVAGMLRMPGSSYRFGASPLSYRRPAPLLGQHNDLGAAWPDMSAKSEPAEPGTDLPAHLPLKGIRVVDLTRFVAGPLLTKQMADLGAEIIKVESIQMPDETRFQRVLPVWPENQPGDEPWNTTWYFNNLNRNKLSLTIDINSGWGRELLLKLISVSDMVVENYRPGVLERANLEYSSIKEAAPDVVMMSMSGFGDGGPYRKFGAYGSTVEAMSGLAGLNGFPDDQAVITGQPYGDWCSGMLGAVVAMAALDHRRRTGEGQRIDLSQSEVVTSFFGETILGYELSGKLPVRSSNRSERMAPHGYFRTAGSDEWVAIAVEDEGRWRSFCEAIGQPGLADDPRFATLADRKTNEDALDAIVEAWTSPQDKQAVFHHLQKYDIAAGPVMNARDVLLDPHLAAREYFQRVSFPARPGMPDLKFAKNPVVYGGVRPDLKIAAPDLGEHNSYILAGILGFEDYEVETMAEAEIIGRAPLADLDFSVTDVDEMDRSGAVAARDLDYREKIGLGK